MFNIDTLIIILLPTSIGVAIALTITIWIQDRHCTTLTERRSTTMFSFIKKIFGFLKKKKAEPDDLQVLLNNLKETLPRRLWKEIDDLRDVNDTDRAIRYLNRIASVHSQAREAANELIHFISKQNS